MMRVYLVYKKYMKKFKSKKNRNKVTLIQFQLVDFASTIKQNVTHKKRTTKSVAKAGKIRFLRCLIQVLKCVKTALVVS